MRVIPVELDAETVAALEVERELLGFENRSAYVRWVLEHRGTIDHREDADRPVLLEAYRERIAQLEEQLVNAEAANREPTEARRVSTERGDSNDSDGDRTSKRDEDVRPGVGFEAGDGGWTPSRSDPTVKIRGTPRTTVVSDSDEDSDSNLNSDGNGDGDTDPTSNTESPTDDPSRARPKDHRERGDSIDRARTQERERDTEPAPESDSDLELELPSKTVTDRDTGQNTNTNTDPDANTNTDPDANTNTDPDANAETNDETNAESASERERTLELTTTDRTEIISAMNLTPERVERIREDPVAEDAGVLGSVEIDRLDELSRRAVAKTRERLDRNVETGLEYTSSTGLAAADVRPGEDVVDLESLSVRGRSAELVERRREVAGHAIAFLRDQGRARRSDFVESLYEQYPAGYETTDSWWRCLKEALKQVDAIDGGEGSRVWRFRR
ncbi:MSCRAMM family adhesin SdrC [Halomontanus rarus]|uniref:MSCRAMM family adhesin SdrC n=1 Tax=Halomontanus rarus TaxID=3034020 RepID=UPI001F623E01